jgi:hypothetical protein
VDQNKILIEHFWKELDGTWRMRDCGSRDSALPVETLNVTISIFELYRGVDLSD